MHSQSVTDNLAAMIEALDDIHIAVDRSRSRQELNIEARAHGGRFHEFHVGDYVLVHRAVRPRKTLVRWCGPFRIVSAQSDWVFTVQHLISLQEEDVHSSRMMFYSDSHLDVTEAVRQEIAFESESFEIESLVGVRTDHRTGMREVEVKWRGFEATSNTWEPFDLIQAQAPLLVQALLSRHA